MWKKDKKDETKRMLWEISSVTRGTQFFADASKRNSQIYKKLFESQDMENPLKNLLRL